VHRAVPVRENGLLVGKRFEPEMTVRFSNPRVVYTSERQLVMRIVQQCVIDAYASS